jgi:hypothetical protein
MNASRRIIVDFIHQSAESTQFLNRRQSIAVPSQSGTNKENATRVAKLKRAQSIGGPMDARKGSNIGADGLSPRRRKRRSMVSIYLILIYHQGT